MNTLEIVVLIILILSGLGFILWLFTGGSKPKTKIKPKTKLTPSRIVEILTLLRDTYIKHIETTPPNSINLGLCGILIYLRNNNLIPYLEYNEISDILYYNKPRTKHAYWWPINDTKSRVKFLNNLIKKYEEVGCNVKSE